MKYVISYPSLAEFLGERYRPGSGKLPLIDAREIGVTEATVQGWVSGQTIGTQHIGDVERVLEYSFAERRFAEAAADAGFPAPDAPVAIRRIRSYRDFVTYVREVSECVPQASVAALCGWHPSIVSDIFRGVTRAPDRASITRALGKLVELDRQSRGVVLGPCTPRSVYVRILHECRLARGQDPAKFAATLKLRSTFIRALDEIARGLREDSSGKRHAGYFKDGDDQRKLAEALTREREVLRQMGHRISPNDDDANVPEDAVPAKTSVITCTAAQECATSEAIPDVQEGRPQSLDDRIAFLEQAYVVLSRRLDRFERASGAPVDDPPATSPSDFRVHDERVDTSERARGIEMIRAAAVFLKRCAGIRDDASRCMVQREVTPAAEDLFLELDRFFREHPSAAGAIIAQQRRFIEEQRKQNSNQ